MGYKKLNEEIWEIWWIKRLYYGELRNTSNIKDRLHTQDIIDIAYNNKFLFIDGKIAEVFKTMNLGEHRKQCNIKKKVQTGCYFLIYKGGQGVM